MEGNTAPTPERGAQAELEDLLRTALARADELGLSFVAIRISEALDLIGSD